jgi:hypothetical protein
MNLIWGCTTQNNPPEISEITFMGDHYIGVEYTFSAAASDPDGDTLNYSWSVSGGSLTNPNTNPVKWTMPNTFGNYYITVVVDDGNGGQDEKTETVEVKALPTATLYQTLGGGSIVEGFHVSLHNMADVGDSSNDRTLRGFLSFDISNLSGKEIISAEMKFSQFNIYENPYSLIEKIRVEAVYWGNDDVQLGDYNIPRVILGLYDIPNFTCSSTQLIDALNQAIDDGRDRFQIRLSHKGLQTDHDGVPDSITYGKLYPVEFNVTYMP